MAVNLSLLFFSFFKMTFDVVHGEISLAVTLGLSDQRLPAQGAQWTGRLPREGGREGRAGVDGRREGGREEDKRGKVRE